MRGYQPTIDTTSKTPNKYLPPTKRDCGGVSLNECKRMAVYAMADGYIVRNGNDNECTGEVGNCGCVHAEARLLKLVPHPHTVYITHSPCIDCAKKLVVAGVKRVVFCEEYRLRDGIDYLLAHDVSVSQQFFDEPPTRFEGSD